MGNGLTIMIQPEPSKKGVRREYIFLFVLLTAAFLVRVAFFGNQGYAAVDTTDFMLWFQHAVDVGPHLFYANNYWCDYPPFNIFFFWIFGNFANSLHLFGSTMFTYIMKLPANFFDMATAALIFFFVRKRVNLKVSLLATAIYAFNPAVVFDAAVWGQFDAIYAFLLVSSLLLVFRGKPKWAVVAFMLGVLTKPQSIALAPLFFFIVWRKSDWKNFAASILVAAVTVFAVILPYQWPNSNPVTFLTSIYFGAYSTYGYTTVNAFNFWGFGGMWVPDTQATFLLGWAMFAVAVAFVLYYVHKRIDIDDKELIVLLGAFVSFFAFFMLPTRIHERYLFPALAILVLMVPFLKRARPLYLVLTATCFVNQAYVLSFLNASAFIQAGDPVVLAVSLINSVSFLYVIVLMIRDLRIKGQAQPGLALAASASTGESEMTVETPSEKPQITPAPQSSEHQPPTRTRVQKRLRLGLNRRDLFSIVLLCVVFLALATYNLGLTQSPTTTVTFTAGQSFYLDLGSVKNVGSMYILLEDGGYNITVSTGTPQNWQVSVFGLTYSDWYKWSETGIHLDTQYIRVEFAQSTSSNAIIAEVAVTDSSGQKIALSNATAISPSDMSVVNLIDEQNLVVLPPTYMEQTYFDEIYFARTAVQYLHLQSPYEWTHPPLGKLIQAGGIAVFGFSPFGWRFVGVIFGTLMIAVMYVLGKRLFGTWIGGFAAAFLLTFDFMHFTMARMGTADTYVVFFAMLSQLFFFIYLANVVKNGWRTSVIPLFFAVIFFMLGFSTKWLTLFAGLGMLVLLAALRIRDLTKLKAKLADKYAAFFDHPFMMLLAFILIGVAIYFATYIPDMLTGRPFVTWPIGGPSDPGIAVVNLQFKMYEYHAGLTATHTFESPWWSWPLMVNPFKNLANSALPAYVPLWVDVTYGLPNNIISTITVMGNPAVWWVGFVLMLVLAERAIRGRELVQALKTRLAPIVWRFRSKLTRSPKASEPQVTTTISDLSTPRSSQPPMNFSEDRQPPSSGVVVLASPSEPSVNPTTDGEPPKPTGRPWDIAAIFIVTVFFFAWIPFNAISRVTFIYHFYVSVPFLCFASAYFINKYWNTRKGKIATLVFFAAVIALFIAFYPVISGMPTPTSYVHYLKWFPSWFFAP